MQISSALTRSALWPEAAPAQEEPTMTLAQDFLYLATAVILGVAIGFERQWRQRPRTDRRSLEPGAACHSGTLASQNGGRVVKGKRSMSEQKFYIPHRYQGRGSGIIIDPKTPNVGQVYFDVDGSARYIFAISRRELKHLARAIERKLEEVPPAPRRRKSVR
jgi:hypothetical protein